MQAIGHPHQPTADAATVEARAEPRVGLGRLAWMVLVMGATPVGGQVPVVIFNELVRRRGWLSNEEFLEGQALARMLPGPKGINMVAHALQRLGGPPALALTALFVLPGLLCMSLLTLVVFGSEHPAWLQGALRGLSATAAGLVLAMTLQAAPAIRAARLGGLSAALACLGTLLLGLDLLMVLLTAGLLSLAANRPRR